MDPEFTKILLRVTLLGAAIFAIGAGILVVAFRAFGRRDTRATVLIGVALVFVFLCCVVLLRMSVVR